MRTILTRYEKRNFLLWTFSYRKCDEVAEEVKVHLNDVCLQTKVKLVNHDVIGVGIVVDRNSKFPWLFPNVEVVVSRGWNGKKEEKEKKESFDLRLLSHHHHSTTKSRDKKKLLLELCLLGTCFISCFCYSFSSIFSSMLHMRNEHINFNLNIIILHHVTFSHSFYENRIGKKQWNGKESSPRTFKLGQHYCVWWAGGAERVNQMDYEMLIENRSEISHWE